MSANKHGVSPKKARKSPPKTQKRLAISRARKAAGAPKRKK